MQLEYKRIHANSPRRRRNPQRAEDQLEENPWEEDEDFDFGDDDDDEGFGDADEFLSEEEDKPGPSGAIVAAK